jgi:HD-like signal output (HDOD) protein
MDNEIIDRLNRIEDLPSLPEIVMKLSSAVENPDTDAAAVARIIGDDPALTTKILRVVNSAYYGRGGVSKEITSVPFAVARIGFREIKNIVLTMASFSFFRSGTPNIHLRNFWRHSVLTAITTKTIHDFAKDDRIASEQDLDMYYVTGLLHDIGVLALDFYFNEILKKVIIEMRSSRIMLPEAERRVLGVDHATIGGYITRAWGLPGAIVAAVENHHSPEMAPEPVRRMARVVNLANYICAIHGPHFCADHPEDDSESPLSLKALGIPVKSISEIMDIVEEEAARSDVLLTIS